MRRNGYERNDWYPYLSALVIALVFILFIILIFYSGENVVNKLDDVSETTNSLFLNDGVNVNIVSPLESNGAVPVNIQDQTSPPIDFFFSQINGPPTVLATDTAIDAYSITVVDASNCSIGDYLGMFNSDFANDNRAYFGTIINIVGNVITLDTPIDFAFQPGDTVGCFQRDLSVDGSITRQIYSIQVGPNSDQSIDITRIMISMITDSAVSLSEFGDIPSLTNGLVLRRVDGDTRNIWNVKNNGEIANLCFDYTPYESTNPAQGQDGAKFRYSFAGQDKHGVAVRLNPGDSLELIVQDNLTDIAQFRVIAEGHYVTD